MEVIHENDLQNRLKKLYEENINLSIKIYERNLTLRVMERAKRSAGMYETEKEILDSVKRVESISNKEKEKLEK